MCFCINGSYTVYLTPVKAVQYRDDQTCLRCLPNIPTHARSQFPPLGGCAASTRLGNAQNLCSFMWEKKLPAPSPHTRTACSEGGGSLRWSCDGYLNAPLRRRQRRTARLRTRSGRVWVTLTPRFGCNLIGFGLLTERSVGCLELEAGSRTASARAGAAVGGLRFLWRADWSLQGSAECLCATLCCWTRFYKRD